MWFSAVTHSAICIRLRFCAITWWRRMLLVVMSLLLPGHASAQIADIDTLLAEDPQRAAATLVAAAIDQTRGLASYASMTMTIKRPTYSRTSELVAWTRGREDALIRFTAPAKDAGNATLKQGEKMWTFNPKLNRTIRLPFSLMSQSWAGSDFSYNDLSRTDQLLRHYTLTLTETDAHEGHRVFTIEAVPHDDAPVVWGKETLVIRDDYVLIEQTFFDQDLQPLKRMSALEIGEMGGRTISKHTRMVDLEKPDNYTELRYTDADFEAELDDNLFTLFSLKAGSRR